MLLRCLLTVAETRRRVLDQGCLVPCRGHEIQTKPVTSLHVTLLGRGFDSRHLHQNNYLVYLMMFVYDGYSLLCET